MWTDSKKKKNQTQKSHATVPIKHLKPEDCAEEDGEDDEPPVPVVLVVDGGHAQEHEDHRLGAARQHLHPVLNRRLRAARHVSFHVVLYKNLKDKFCKKSL